MKTPTSDRLFIEFVEALQKIERDLVTLNKLDEIANTTVLSKLESRLPVQIRCDWIKKLVTEKLTKKTSKEKYAQFMNFLKEAKAIATYDNPIVVRSGENRCLSYWN